MYMAKKLIKNPESFSRRFGVLIFPVKSIIPLQEKIGCYKIRAEAGIKAHRCMSPFV